MREAASLAPDNAKVKEVVSQIQEEDGQAGLRQLCARFAHDKDEEAGKNAIRYLNRSAEVPAEIAKECVGLLLNDCVGADTATRDEMLKGLLRESLAAKAALARRLSGSHGGIDTTAAFDLVFKIGDGAASGIVAVILDSSVWSTEAARVACEKDIFQLFLTKLLDAGSHQNGRAMRAIARLLAADASKLHGLMDEITVDAILSTLDYRNATEIKSQATLAIAKYLEASESKGQAVLTKYVTSRVAQNQNTDLVLAFSAAAAVFPVAPALASSLFLVEGFVSSLPALLEKKAKSGNVEHAALDMLAAACIDSACREAISKHCTVWLQHIMNTGKGEQSGQAAVILAKLSGPVGQSTDEGQSTDSVDELLPRFQKMLNEGSAVDKKGSIEGLAYASIRPLVKARLAKDKSFLSNLVATIQQSQDGSPVIFGCLNILNNLTRYPPNLSEEQKRMTQLKDYANAAGSKAKKPAQPDPLDQEPTVTLRCKSVLDAGSIPAFVVVRKTLSPASIGLVFNIVLSIAWPQPHRGKLAQQGAVKLLLQLYTKIPGTDVESAKARHTAAHAIARILTSVDPKLVFPRSGTPNATSAVRPLISLLSEDPLVAGDGPRDLLPTFEALLALANMLVDVYEDATGSCGDLIARLVHPALDDLILQDNVRIRRAATQLVPNLVQHPAGLDLFDDGTDAASRRLHILLALSGSDDLETRKAAGGALAVLCGYEGCVKSMLKQERGVKLLLAMLDDTDDEMVYRGLYAIASTVVTTGDTGKAAKAMLRGLGLEDKLEMIVETAKSPQNSEMAATALNAFNG